MLIHRIPGVYVETRNLAPRSVDPVETAIPVFIGYTEQARDENGDSIENRPVRIASLQAFEEYFGGAALTTLYVDVQEMGGGVTVVFQTEPGLSAHFLHHGLQLFFANGGGPCYVVSIGDYGEAPDKSDFMDALDVLEESNEPTLIVFPDACLLSPADYGEVVNSALAHCNTMQDRFTIADVPHALPGSTDSHADVATNFRDYLTSDPDLCKYGAAYFPYVRTSFPWRTDDASIIIKSHVVDGNPGGISADVTLASINSSHTAVYEAVRRFVHAATVTMPPSPAVAGAYARTDRERGVWKAPANVSLHSVIEPAISISNELNDRLNVDAGSGKSVNVIRVFLGKGTLIWGARTLAGTDSENRYVPVRRFLNFIGESIKKSLTAFAVEPNDADTWASVRSMIENFLITLWRSGALAGTKSEEAYFVQVGKGQTMTEQDLRDGKMIVGVGLSIIRPAEFIILRITQKMQTTRAAFRATEISTDEVRPDAVLAPSVLKKIRGIKTSLARQNMLSNRLLTRRRRFPGSRILLVGASAAEKTAAASLLAKDSGRKIFRVDLSAVESKYIGETEKNLSNLLDQAHREEWILFFDEADALFGKRTKVKDAHDRYANQEISYVRQRIENFDGVVVLASSSKANLDAAFLRRLRAVIEFPPPKA